MLKLKHQYFHHLMRRVDSLLKTLMVQETEGKREWQRMRRLDSIIDSMDMDMSKLWEIETDKKVWCASGYGVTKSQVGLSE